MNIKFSLIILALVFTFVSVKTEEAVAQQKPTISISTNKKSYSPGETVRMTIRFNTVKGVKIPKEPPISVTITEGNISGDLLDYTAGSSEYINNSRVVYTFKIPANTSSGKLKVSGRVNYGYCNESDGICKLGNNTFTRNITVK